MGDLNASGTNPGTIYTPPLPAQPPYTFYHEDREINTGSGDTAVSQMYRVYNAIYQPVQGTWQIQNSDFGAYANVQNPDGSIHYYTLNSLGTWEGSGNNAVFNAVDFGMSTTATDNSAALTTAINTALNAGGGMVYIPPGTYQFTNAVGIPYDGPPGSDPGIIIAGAGGGTMLEQTELQDLFSFSGLSSGNGLRIRDLHISNTATVEGPPPNPPAAVRVYDCEAVTCERVVFLNWPRALHLDNESDQCGLRDCRISYGYGSNPVANYQTMIYISGTEDFIDHCIIEQPSQAAKTPGPTDCTAIFSTKAASVLTVTNSHISQFTFGINIQGGNPNPVRAFFSKVVCECWTNAVILKPEAANATLYQVFFGDCIFARESDSTDTTSVGVYIDTSGGPSTNVSEIFFSNCLCYLWNTAGIQINAGQNIVINGGRYGSNASSVSTSGGIAVTGTTPNVVPANVSIVGVDFTSQLGEVPPSPPPNQFPQQPHAISITAAVAGLYVRDCNMSGYSAPNSPIYAQSAGTQIEITDCAGYNDQCTLFTLKFPGSSVTVSNATLGYYGPVVFYVSGDSANTTVEINTATQGPVNTGLPNGTFTLPAGGSTSATVSWTSGEPTLVVIGM